MGDRLTWIGARPALQEGVAVRVTLVESTSSQGVEMAEALAALAASGGLSSIADPLAWERAQRQERELPGRSS